MVAFKPNSVLGTTSIMGAISRKISNGAYSKIYEVPITKRTPGFVSSPAFNLPPIPYSL